MHQTSATRVRALAGAEWKQFRRNKVILFMVAIVLLGIPLLMLSTVPDDSSPEDIRSSAAFSLQLLVLMAVVYVLYYSVLSMATTRRDEGVLKRLRTGEAKDSEILMAICAPSTMFVLAAAALTPVVVMVAGSAAPVNILLYVLAILGGVIVGGTLALITSAFTKNAEAAQVTSIPVIVIGMISLSGFRNLLPEGVRIVAEKNPFGVIMDLVNIGWAGIRVPDVEKIQPAMDMGESLQDGGLLAAQLVAWCVALVLVTRQVMRWDPR